MNGTGMREVERLARKTGWALIVTTGPEGWPHTAVAKTVTADDSRGLVVTGWFCPVTEENLDRDPRVSIIVWDGASGDGFQVSGWREGEKTVAMIDGYAPGLEAPGLPQTERELRLRAERVLIFRHALHTDEERAPR